MTGAAATGLAWSAPWWLALAAAAWRWRGNPSLDDVPATPPDPPPPIRIVVPARDEAAHIASCVRALLASDYPALRVVVVDDHSRDGTGDLARAAGGGDPRLTVVSPPPLPPGWLGKQWACHAGAAGAQEPWLLFTDADVRHAPDLHARLLGAALASDAALVSVAGFQETRTFWERVVQPFVFAILLQWYGGPGAVNRARSPRAKIANGQCLFFRRGDYEAFGGHATVRASAAEDLAFAQLMSARGFRVHLRLGERQLSTRMYDSLGAMVEGWGKNVYAGGREALPGGVAGAMAARLLVPLPGVLALLPPALLAWGGTTGATATAWFGASATAAMLAWFAAVVHRFRIPAWYAALFPLAGLTYLWIAVRAVARGERVRWKGREYAIAARHEL